MREQLVTWKIQQGRRPDSAMVGPPRWREEAQLTGNLRDLAERLKAVGRRREARAVQRLRRSLTI